MFEPKVITLKNGLRLITAPMPQVESVTVLLAVGAGSRCEAKRVNGLFHFLEHMAFKGTKKRPSAFDISSEIDSVGGAFNAFTGKELTAYYLKLAAKHQELAFDILSDMLTNSLLKKEEIEREKGVIIEEINMYEDTPMRRVQEVFIKLLYGDNSMGWDIAGEKENIRQMKRTDFLNYIRRLYFAANMTLVVAGKINQEETIKQAKAYFNSLKKDGEKHIKTIKIRQKRSKTLLVSKKTEQAHFNLGVPGFSYSHPDRFALGVLATILGGGMSSRLFIQIRERRGLAYYVQCSPEYFTDSGFLVVRAGVRLEGIEEAIKVTLDELRDLVNKKVMPQELKKAQEFLKGRMILALEDSQNVASRYAYQLLLEGKLRTPQQMKILIDQITVADVQRVAKTVFQPSRLNLAVIGPYQNKKQFAKLLNQ